MGQHPCSLSQIVENEHGFHKSPADGDVLPSTMAQVRVKSFSTSGTEKYCTQN